MTILRFWNNIMYDVVHYPSNHDDKNHWICKCGVWNHKTRHRCLGCDKMVPEGIKMVAELFRQYN